jgi:hypothetical protein
MNEGLKKFNLYTNQFLIIGSDDMWVEFQWVWDNYTNGSDYMDEDQIEGYIFHQFITHKPTDNYKDNEWIMEVIMWGWGVKNSVGLYHHMNLRETFQWFIENNYEDLDLTKRSSEEVEMMEKRRKHMCGVN